MNRDYYGSRENDFKNLIEGLLVRGRLKSKYIEALLTPENMKIYGDAFTASSIDKLHNYEVYEQLGDVSANKFIVWYMYKRFPQLRCPQGVKIVARLRINYGAKQSFSQIAEDLGFWPYISAPQEERLRRKKPLLEDVLEAFIGATEYILDQTYRVGIGYAIVNDILVSIFNQIPISLKYKDLYDAKTRLKELFDLYGERLGVLEYKEIKKENDELTTSRVYRIVGGTGKGRKFGGRRFLLGEGKGALKATAQQRAASAALYNLKRQGFDKEDPPEYKLFCSSQ